MVSKSFIFSFFILSLFGFTYTQTLQEKSSEFWLKQAKASVEARAKRSINTKKAKNVIMFLGDGMSHQTIAAARMALGGENKKVAFEEFPYVASSKTSCFDYQIPDSACTATAYLTGVKANFYTTGLNPNGYFKNCNDSMDQTKWTNSIAEWFQDAGRSAGIVTTATVTHASPSGAYAHIADRNWESNVNVLKDGCDDMAVDDIAEQLVYNSVGSKFKVILGGGSTHFISTTDSEHGEKGSRTDGKNLIKEWLKKGRKRDFVRNRSELLKVNPNNTSQLFGLFHSSHLPFHLTTVANKEESIYPSLAEMTVKAIEMLSTDTNGYFLFVEGGRIDHGNHATLAKMAIDETIEFSKAIRAAINTINLDETLIVVTADHGHVLSYSGYAPRGHDIFSTAGVGDDSLEYFTLSYANGPGYSKHRVNNARVNPKNIQYTHNTFFYPATVPLPFETHGGDDVGIWAVGPSAHLFHGVIEQYRIPHTMAYISCVGNDQTLCDEKFAEI